MAVTLTNHAPVGGGLGNRKVLLTQLSGTYATNGFELFTSQPLFAMTNKGFTVSFNPSTGKTQIYTDGGSSGGTITIPANDIVASNADAITGTVSGEACAIAVGGASVSGPAESKTYNVSGASYTAGAELANNTSVDGVTIFAIF